MSGVLVSVNIILLFKGCFAIEKIYGYPKEFFMDKFVKTALQTVLVVVKLGQSGWRPTAKGK